MEKRTQIKARIIPLGYHMESQKSDDYSFKFYVICCKPFNYSFNRTMQTTPKRCFQFTIFAHEIEKSENFEI